MVKTAPLTTCDPKPCALTRISYVPGCSRSRRYIPSSSVGAVRVAPRSAFTAVTVAPAIEDPFWSITRPLRVELETSAWAKDTIEPDRIRKNGRRAGQISDHLD